jgi:hypothetical protein
VAVDEPALSVVIVVGDPATRHGLERTLYSLVHQKAIDQMEVLVVDCGAPATLPLKGSDHPRARTVKLPRETTTMAEARAEGVRRA